MKHSIMFDNVHRIELPTQPRVRYWKETEDPVSSYLQCLHVILASGHTDHDEESRDNRTSNRKCLLLMGLSLHNEGKGESHNMSMRLDIKTTPEIPPKRIA